MAKRFTDSQMRRIAAAVKKIEAIPLDTSGQTTPNGIPLVEFWAELTAEDSSNPGRYQWKKINVSWSGSGSTYFADSNPLISSGSAYTAISPNGSAGLTGSKVYIRFSGYTGSYQPIYLIVGAPAAGSPTFWAKILTAVSVSTNKWKYTWREQRRTATGWENKPWPYREGTTSNGKYGYNSLEAWNTATGVTGNGINHATSVYPTLWSMRSAATGTPVVRMYEETDSAICYSFEYSNAEEGAC